MEGKKETGSKLTSNFRILRDVQSAQVNDTLGLINDFRVTKELCDIDEKPVAAFKIEKPHGMVHLRRKKIILVITSH